MHWDASVPTSAHASRALGHIQLPSGQLCLVDPMLLPWDLPEMVVATLPPGVGRVIGEYVAHHPHSPHGLAALTVSSQERQPRDAWAPSRFVYGGSGTSTPTRPWVCSWISRWATRSLRSWANTSNVSIRPTRGCEARDTCCSDQPRAGSQWRCRSGPRRPRVGRAARDNKTFAVTADIRSSLD